MQQYVDKSVPCQKSIALALIVYSILTVLLQLDEQHQTHALRTSTPQMRITDTSPATIVAAGLGRTYATGQL